MKELILSQIYLHSELQQLNNALISGANILIVAPNGFGKSALWKYTQELANDYKYFNLTFLDTTFAKGIKSLAQEYHEQDPEHFYLPPSVLKNDLSQLAQDTFQKTGQLPWSRLAHFFGRAGVDKVIDLLLYSFHWKKEYELQKDSKNSRKPIIFVRNLKRITDANVPVFINLFHHCQVIAVLDTQYQHLNHIKKLRQNFQSVLELRPLPTDACRQITESWLEHTPDISFESDKARRLFIEHIARDSAGQPGAIEQLLSQAKTEPEITRDKVREFEWEGVEYMSMYPIFMIMLAILTVLRTLGRSMGDTTWLVIGAISGVMLIIAFFLRPILDKESK
jgi:hypothetical protein